MKMKRKLVLLVIGALLLGLLPVENATISTAATTPASTSGRTARADYGLNNPTTDSDGVTTWDCVWFGNYWQEDTNGDGKADTNDEKQPIKWRVLSVNGEDAFLLADKGLDCQRYNDTYTSVTWETCTMRSWLNGYGAASNREGKDYSSNNFLSNAFSADEQSAICTTNVANNDNSEYGTEGGNDTSDKVYLLSIDEVMNPSYGFSSDDSKQDESRRAKNTAYAKAQGVYTSTDTEYAGNGWWWLRSPGDRSIYASNVNYDGFVYRTGYYVDFSSRAVRPALHLNLKASSDAISASSWSYAGKVNSKGVESGMAPPVPATSEPIPSSVPEQTPVLGIPAQPTEPANPTTDSDGVTTWDCVWFGNYWQEDTNGDGKADTNDAKQPIKWRVLSVNGDDAFLLADKCLDCQRYNDTYTSVTWETCTMRSWLNGYGAASNREGKNYGSNNFLSNAFSADEQSAIRTINVVNNNNSEFGTEGGNDTSDKVYLLSLDEVMNPAYGFSSDLSDERRGAKNTKYAEAQGALTVTFIDYAGNGYWWLRSPGFNSFHASYVRYDGNVYRLGYSVDSDINAVRPALHLNLKASSDAISASSWSYAGKVNSSGIEIEVMPPDSGTPALIPSSVPEQTPVLGTPAQPTESPGITPTVKPIITQPGTVISLVPGSSTQATTPVIQPQTPPAASGVGKVESVKLTQKKQAVTVSWKKIPGVAGYQVWYSTSKKWKGKKQKSVRENKVTVKNLKKKKTYYFRVRAYRLEGTKKVYGGWSKTKQITIKKASGGIVIL